MSTLPASAATDAHLMARITRGDAKAFEAIYDRHKVSAYSLARRIAGPANAAEEATQDAFLTLWRHADRYEAGRGSVRSWLLTMVRHRSIDALRRAQTRAVAQEWSEEAAERIPSPVHTEELAIANAEGAHARRLVAALPPEQRRVIELAFFGGYTQREIAMDSGVPLGTIKGRARLGLAKLREAQLAGGMTQVG